MLFVTAATLALVAKHTAAAATLTMTPWETSSNLQHYRLLLSCS